MKTIAIITHNICFGGVQKNAVLLANSFAQTHEVSLVLFEEKPFSYHLDSRVKVFTLSHSALTLENKTEDELEKIGEALFNARSSELLTLFENIFFDVVVSFEDYNNLCTLKALKNGMKAIVSSRVSLEYGYKDRLIHLLPPSFYKTHIQTFYPKADAVVSVSDGVKNELAELGISATTITNGIEIKKVQTLAQEDIAFNDKFFLHVGRFDATQKAQDEVVKAYQCVASRLQSSLMFVGDGKDRSKIEALVRAYKLQERIIFMGFDENPYKYMSQCKGFIFSSYYEGMPNALLEALSLGCAVVAYKFEPSWKEFDGKEAILFVEKGNIKELSKALIHLEKKPKVRAKLQKNAQKISLLYTQETCLQHWRELITAIAQKENN